MSLLRAPRSQYELVLKSISLFYTMMVYRLNSVLRASSDHLLFTPLHHHTFSPRGVVRLSFTPRIERAQFHRARCSSTENQRGYGG